jgi:hypothetical protein
VDESIKKAANEIRVCGRAFYLKREKGARLTEQKVAWYERRLREGFSTLQAAYGEKWGQPLNLCITNIVIAYKAGNEPGITSRYRTLRELLDSYHLED